MSEESSKQTLGTRKFGRVDMITYLVQTAAMMGARNMIIKGLMEYIVPFGTWSPKQRSRKVGRVASRCLVAQPNVNMTLLNWY